MKTLLILAYDFPPYVSVGGLRPYSWFEYLHEYNVYPVVVTRQWSNKHGNHLDYIERSDLPYTITETSETGIIIRTPYSPNLANKLLLRYGEKRFKLLRKTITGWFEIIQWFFNVGPKAGLYHGAKKYLKHNKVDAIIATGDPFVLFRYASKLSKQFHIPWVADYRDPWTSGAGHQSLLLFKDILAVDEKKIVRTARVVTSVSDFFAKKINDVIKEGNYFILPNGYHPDFALQVQNLKQNTGVLNIGFAGTISKYHPIKEFLLLISQIITEQPGFRMKINFYGTNLNDFLENHILENHPELSDVIAIHPRLPNDEVMNELAGNNALLLFNNYSFIGTKIYDYLAVRRKILLCYDDDSEANELRKKYFEYDGDALAGSNPQKDLIQETNSGIIVRDRFHLKEILNELHEEHAINGLIACESKGIEKYSRKIQAERLAGLIKEIESY